MGRIYDYSDSCMQLCPVMATLHIRSLKKGKDVLQFGIRDIERARCAASSEQQRIIAE